MFYGIYLFPTVDDLFQLHNDYEYLKGPQFVNAESSGRINPHHQTFFLHSKSGPRSAVGNVSGYRCVSDCKSRGREFDPGPVPYFRGD